MTERLSRQQGTMSDYVARNTRQLRRHAHASPIENVNTVAASGSTQTIPDVTAFTMNHVTLSANCTLTFPSPVAGASFTLKLIQDDTGSRTVTWPSSSVRRFVSGTTPTLSTAAGAIDLFAVVCDDGSKWDIVFAAKGLS